MDTTQSQQIARTILDQINYGDKWFLPSVGAKNFHSMSEDKEFSGGLGFQCNGLQHKGWVKIQLRWMDDYTITFVNKKREVVKVLKGIFCDQLVEMLDYYVEGSNVMNE